MAEPKVKFSGNKTEFESGATRDTAENKGRFDLIPPGPLRKLALVYEQGAKNHSPHNWEKGFNFSRALDSALRHINQYKDGQRDEPHLLNAVWNLFAIVHFEEMIERGLLPKELNDLPNYQKVEAEVENLEENNDCWDNGTQPQPRLKKK